jgi:eukaryotic-like serine/threonine-protein kinase
MHPASQASGLSLVTLDGRYHIVERVASGGMGEVFRAHDAVLAREVAIKVLHRSLAADQSFVDRFRREARAAAGLTHPNIVAIYDWGAVDGIYYMVMEFVRGQAARTLLNSVGRLEPAQATDVVRQTLVALESAHRQGIVHRDVKPENILITTEGVVKVADFGLARAYADARATQVGTVTGTVQYLAPEQIRGEPADPRSDLYSLGIVTYELLTGKLPFTGDTAMAIASKHLSDRVPPPSACVSSITPELDAFVVSATDRDRELRPESAAEMRRDIESIAVGLPAARKLASLVGDMPQVTASHDAAGATETVKVLSTKTIPRVERTARRRWRKTFATIVLIAATLAAAWGAWTYLIPHRVTVPPLAGVNVELAKNQLEHLGLVPNITHGAYSTQVPAGSVLKVTPIPGTTLKRGQVVTLVPSLGPPPRDIPPIKGMTQDAATKALQAAGFTVGTNPTQQFDKKVPLGDVVSWSPPGSTAPQGSTIDLVISSGPPPTPLPDVTGQPQKAAEKLLKKAGFLVTVVPGFSDTVAKGLVLNTDPPGGPDKQVPYGSTITLSVSVGPETFPCPDFKGMTLDEARAAAKSYGLQLQLQRIPGSTGDQVISQLPIAGYTVHYNDTILLYYI